jgi:MFS family permease
MAGLGDSWIFQFARLNASDERSTLYLDILRNGSGGFIDACERTFFLLIAITALNAGNWAKSLIAGGVGIGFLCSPYVVQVVRRSQRPVTELASRLLFVAAAFSAFGGVFRNQVAYMVGTTVGLALQGSIVPLMTALYNRNYPEGRRGRYISAAIFVRVALMTVLGLFVADVLERSLESGGTWAWRIVPWGAAAVYFGQALLVRRMPSGPLRLRDDEPPNERAAWVVRRQLIRDDAVLRNVLVAWMFMGFANLMMLPLRVEYLSNPDYGLAYKASDVALLTTVVPAIMRLLLTFPFGWAFDRLPFFAMRIFVNILFAVSIVSFFLGSSRLGLTIGAVLLGIATAGGDVLWNLWTVKFAPPGRVADYMALHTFFTGVRGVLAPILGFYLISRVSIPGMGWLCAALIAVSSLMLIPYMRTESRKVKPARQ